MTPSSPSAPLAMMNSTSPSKRLCSTLTTRSAYFMSGRRGLLHLFTLCARLFDGANHVESLLREVIVLALQDLGEALHRLADLDVLALAASEALGNEVGLRQEPLDLPRARYCQLVVRRHVHSLDRGDRSFDGRGDALLQLAHLGRERRLVAHSARHAAEQRGHFGTGQQVAEDVVHEQEDVGPLLIAKVLGHREARQSDAGTGARWFVHLAEYERGLGQHAGIPHLVVHVVALARPLPHAREDRSSFVLIGDVADELLDDDGLAGAGASEQPDLRALGEGAHEVDDLDPSLEDLDLRLLL